MQELYEQLHKLFNYEDGQLVWKYHTNRTDLIGKPAGNSTVGSTGYRQLRLNGVSYRLHRLIWLYHHGYLPKIVDHINRDRLDNRIENLREATHSGSNANRKAIGASEYKGVARCRSRWRARIKKDGKYMHIGTYDTEVEAAKAYNQKAVEIHGEFAYINTFEDK